MMQWVLPAIMHKQFRIYHESGRAIAYVAWAYLSEEDRGLHCSLWSYLARRS